MTRFLVLRVGVIVGWAFVVPAVGCALFVLFSYLVAFVRSPRAWGAPLLRAIFVEIMTTVVLGPLWPLWFLIGGFYQAAEEGAGKARGRRNPVILLHGFAMNRTQWLWMGRRLREKGHGPLYGFNYFSLATVGRSGQKLDRFIDDVLAREHETAVDIVAHSMGGLVARFYIERMNGSAKVQRLITIGTPHQGTRFGRWGLGLPGARDLVGGSALLTDLGPVRPGVSYTSIWSRADAIIQPPESSSIAPAGRDEIFDDLGHLSLVLSPRVVDVIDARLRA